MGTSSSPNIGMMAGLAGASGVGIDSGKGGGAASTDVTAGTDLPPPPTFDLTNLPQYQQPALPSEFAPLSQAAQQQDVIALQQRAKMDTAALLARYGSRLALAGSTTSPLM